LSTNGSVFAQVIGRYDEGDESLLPGLGAFGLDLSIVDLELMKGAVVRSR
jgi:hypothetical protein